MLDTSQATVCLWMSVTLSDLASQYPKVNLWALTFANATPHNFCYLPILQPTNRLSERLSPVSESVLIYHKLVSVQASVESNHIHLDTERLETSMSLLRQSLPIPAYNMFRGAFATVFTVGRYTESNRNLVMTNHTFYQSTLAHSLPPY